MKPSPYRVREAVNRAEAEADECAFIGDSVSDVLAGRLAGVAVIGFANRPQGQHPDAGRCRCCDHPAQRDQRGTARSTPASSLQAVTTFSTAFFSRARLAARQPDRATAQDQAVKHATSPRRGWVTEARG
jgi:beta-phosphoglucomutase-like phosphatase (HAD superfamily)